MDKATYWKNRKENKRGQGTIGSVFYPKGEDAGVLNSKGSHLVRVPGQGLTYVNRIESRKKNSSSPATKRNYKYQHNKLGFRHDVNPATQAEPKFMSNHLRHRENQVARKVAIERKAQNNEVQAKSE